MVVSGWISALRSRFSASDLVRGSSYWREQRVELQQRSGHHTAFTVRGSRSYNVLINHVAAAAGRFTMSCSCPRYQDKGQCKHLWAALLELDRQGLESAEPDRHAAWRTFLDAAEWHDLPAHSEPATTPLQERPWISLTSTYELRDGVSLTLFRQQRLRDGRWGKAKRWGRARQYGAYQREPLSSDDPAVHSAVKLFEVLTDASDRPRYAFDEDGFVAFLPRTLYTSVLPTLTAAGMLTLYAGERQPPALRWSEHPWQLVLVGEQMLDGSGRLRGELVRSRTERQSTEKRAEQRAEQKAALSDFDFLDNGLAVHGDTISPVDDERDRPWLEELDRDGSYEVAPTDIDALAIRLAVGPSPEHIEVPDDWQVERRRAVPIPVLEVVVRAVEDDPQAARSQVELAFDYPFGRLDPTTEDRPNDPQQRIVKGEPRCIWTRDPALESAALERLLATGLVPPNAEPTFFSLHGRPERFASVLEELLRDNWQVFVDGKRIRAAHRSEMRVKSGIDWLQVQGELGFGDDNAVSLPELLRGKRKSPWVQLGDGSVGLLPRDWLRRLGWIDAASRGASDTGVDFAASQVLLLDALFDPLDPDNQIEYDQRTRALRGSLRTFEGIRPALEPEQFRGELRDYQRLGVGWLQFLDHHRLGGCLADDMGLGKTIQLLAFLLQRKLDRSDPAALPSLVVAPRSVVQNWLQEAQRFAPDLQTLDYTGLGRAEKRERMRGSESGGGSSTGMPTTADLVVTTYGTLRRDRADLSEIPFDVVVLDEAQAIKNPRSQTAAASCALDARLRLALTGTPIENHLGDLASLFQFLNPGMLGALPSMRALVDPDANEPSALQAAARTLRPLILRRTKEEVLTELPPKNELTLACELSAKDRRRYNELAQYYQRQLRDKVQNVGLSRSKIHVLEALLRLRQAACHPALLSPELASDGSGERGAKFPVLLEQLQEVLDSGHKALVFSQFTSLLALLRPAVQQLGVEHVYLDGRTRKRQQLIDRFQNDPDCKLFLISLKAGGVGVNLTAADYVFLLDPWWNPAVEQQAIDRAHRIGQTRPVFAYRLVAKDTVEERIAELQTKKRQLADAILGQDKSLLQELTADDLELLLS